MPYHQKIAGSLTLAERMTGNIRSPSNIEGSIRRPEIEKLPTYTGDYEISPSGEEQVLETNGRKMIDDMTVNPILALTNQEIEALMG